MPFIAIITRFFRFIRKKYSMNITHNMIRNFICALVVLLISAPLHAADLVGEWHVYQAFSDVTEVEVVTPDTLCFALASGHVCRYDLVDGTVDYLTQETGLSSPEVSHIAWCAGAGRLVITYTDSNIDLLSLDGSVLNMPDLMNKSLTEVKDVRGICVDGVDAYLVLSFGVVQINVREGLFVRTHPLDSPVAKWALQQPLKRTDISMLPDESDGMSPLYNSFFHADFTADGRLISVPGEYGIGRVLEGRHPYAVQIMDLESKEWLMADNSFMDTITFRLRDPIVVAADPTDPEHYAVGTVAGLLEYRADTVVNIYNLRNSPVVSGVNSIYYCIVEGMKYDNRGRLWVGNWAPEGSRLLCLDTDGQWYVHDIFGGVEYRGLRDLMIDSRGYLWMVNDDWNDQAVICYVPDANQLQKFTSLYNQNGALLGGTKYTALRCLSEDADGNIWVGTQFGPVYIESSQIYSGDQTLHQYIIARNDGSGLGDYLLNGLDIISLCIDQAGRKWFGTNGNGVYLISADNNTQLAHFTTQNSLLPSDVINHISIDPSSGCVYFCTGSGLASYQSEVTPGADSFDALYCYPNPVRKDFNGLLTICNLRADSEVTITDVNQRVIYRTHTLSGTLQWRPVGTNGQRLKPGVYFIYQTDADGHDGGMCKFMMQ